MEAEVYEPDKREVTSYKKGWGARAAVQIATSQWLSRLSRSASRTRLATKNRRLRRGAEQ